MRAHALKRVIFLVNPYICRTEFEAPIQKCKFLRICDHFDRLLSNDFSLMLFETFQLTGKDARGPSYIEFQTLHCERKS
jgi:hypothetical protein